MKKLLCLGLVVLAGGGCSSMNNTQAGALGGGLIGAAAGTIVGAATGHPGAGAAIGTAAGAGIGALAGHSQDKAEARQAKAQADAAAAYAATHPPMSIADVVSLTHSHVSPKLIIDQIRATNSYYNLTPADITYLQQQGVSEQVISVMISRRGPDAVYVQPRPTGHVYVVEPPPPPVSVGLGVGFVSGPRCRRW